MLIGVPSSQTQLPSSSLSDPPSQMSAGAASPDQVRFLFTPLRKSFSAWLLGVARLEFALRILHFFCE